MSWLLSHLFVPNLIAIIYRQSRKKNSTSQALVADRVWAGKPSSGWRIKGGGSGSESKHSIMPYYIPRMETIPFKIFIFSMGICLYGNLVRICIKDICTIENWINLFIKSGFDKTEYNIICFYHFITNQFGLI